MDKRNRSISARRFKSLLITAAALVVALSAGALSAVPARADAASRPPVLTWATFFGSSGPSDVVNDVVVDDDGNAYVVGSVDGTGLPVTEGAYQPEAAGGTEGFVAKFAPSGELLFSTYFGGTHHEGVTAVDVAGDGSIYLTGTTLSADLPITADAFQKEFKGKVTNCEFACSGDAFVARLSTDGSELLYSSFLGGDLSEVGSAMIVDDSGTLYVAGFTTSPNFPVTPGAFDTVYNTPSCFDQCDADAFVARLSSDGRSLDFATYYGGTSWDSPAALDLDAIGNIYLAGSTRSIDLATTRGAFQPRKKGNGDFDFSGFVASLSPDATKLRYGTYLGTRNEDHATALDVQADGTAWVTGFASRGFPVTDDALQPEPGRHGNAFVTAFTPDGAQLAYSTYFGGNGEDYGRGIVIDSRGRVVVAGSSSSTDLPVRRGFQPRSRGFDDLFVTRFRPGRDRVQFATYLGGRRYEAATALTQGRGGALYVTGASESVDMPLAGAFVQDDQRAGDGFIARLDPGRLLRARVKETTIEPARVRTTVARSTIAWRNATDERHRLAEKAMGFFDSGRRPSSADYYFTFPAGRFVVGNVNTGALQRVAVAPHARYGNGDDEIEVAWARVPLREVFVFDVEVKRGDSSYEIWLEATRHLEATLHEPSGDYRFRVRVRNVRTGETSGWSPPALLGGAS